MFAIWMNNLEMILLQFHLKVLRCRSPAKSMAEDFVGVNVSFPCCALRICRVVLLFVSVTGACGAGLLTRRIMAIDFIFVRLHSMRTMLSLPQATMRRNSPEHENVNNAKNTLLLKTSGPQFFFRSCCCRRRVVDVCAYVLVCTHGKRFSQNEAHPFGEQRHTNMTSENIGSDNNGNTNNTRSIHERI